MRRNDIKIKIVASTLCMVMALTGCAGNTGSTSKEDETKVTDNATQSSEEMSDDWEDVNVTPVRMAEINVPGVFKNALEGKEDIVFHNEKMSFSKLFEMQSEELVEYMTYKNVAYVPAYAVTDINTDGKDEVILEFENNDFGFVALHYSEGTVYAFDLSEYDIYTIPNVDGTFVQDYGYEGQIIKLNFENGELVKNVLAERSSVNNKKYFVNGEKSDKKSYQKILEEETTKDMVSFTGITVSFERDDKSEYGGIYVGQFWCDKIGWTNKTFEFDFDGDDKKEKLVLSCEKLKDDFAYKLKINENQEFEFKPGFDSNSVGIEFIDIDSEDSKWELVFYGRENDDIIDYGIYKYVDGSFIEIDEKIGDNHIHLVTEGDGILRTEYDSDNMTIGCFYLKENYKYEEGQLVKLEKDIFELSDYSAEFEYILQKDIDVYSDYDLNEKINTLKIGDKLTIARIHTSGYEENEWGPYVVYDAAEVLLDGEVVGWINIKSEKNEWGEGIFGASIPAWD